MARLILDTGVLITGQQGRLDLAVLAGDDDVVVPTMAVAEYLAGVALGGDPARRAAETTFLDELLAVTPTFDYTVPVARAHAELLAHVRRTGQPRGAHDLVIAACAVAADRVLVTTDAKARFEELPGVRARLLDP
ncbi:hypothetical protein SAMN04487820_101445 [Actinopolyspora mzabensis]|uniref:Ribonuclease VapC n=1 Tax=Actinopolyspora mzabensis TaxID=995066 RepID=A0A1G8W1N1_ACTMZ|nr:PIN domain-containing protein [Actinopolyspora mzabensis]SDJ71635.1 hypothetical protein SAMN04487820_101445 [Actinopolyspora mzabensis]